jgi:hypothetical protein
MHFWSNEKHQILSTANLCVRKLIRVGIADAKKARDGINSIFGDVRILEIYKDELGFISPICTEAELSHKLNQLTTYDGINEVGCAIGIEGELI